ncbi:MAG: peptidase T [Lachnospiraceae bacterium]|nr:peptidase T [Lachnospiraceae bacterium]MBQ3905568.1 peptidase T [Lachnospiraceae bacterium]
MEKLNPVERFLRYVQFDTQSDENANASPSTAKQHELAKALAAELKEMGAKEVTYDKKHCYVYATIPATKGFETAPTLGFIAHMDTSPAVTGANVKPRIIKKYDGKDIVLNKKKQIVMKVEEFPELKELAGESLIVTDGTTLLGADDKAGVSEIMTMADFILRYPEIGHGKIRVAFTPDEEIGMGPAYFDVKLFGADFAYTVDGGALGELEYENFNAASGKLTVHGRNTHPGSAKGKMINSILIAQEFQSLLPTFENPMYTEGYEGFIHLDGIRGNVEETSCDYIIRDHDKKLFEKKKETFVRCAEFLNQKYGEGTVDAQVTDSYYNMRDVLGPHMHLVDNAVAAMEELGIEPKVVPIRGGTDGARLSFMGLPCPNLCTGGANYHSRFEYAHVQGMEKTTELLIRLVEIYAKLGRK